MRIFLLVALLLSLACVRSELIPEAQLSLVVAASVGPAATEFASQIEKSMGLKVRVQAGASSLVARQIASGLPCDVVILADDEWMDYLSEQKAIEDATRRPMLANRLAWIVKKEGAKKSGKAARVALADPQHVPAGKYAKTALKSLGLWEEVAANMVAAPDVRTALLWVERGEVDSGIVYQTDARSSDKVTVKTLFEESKIAPIRYPIAQCRSKNMRAKELYRALNELAATKVFQRFGFQIVTSENERT